MYKKDCILTLGMPPVDLKNLQRIASKERFTPGEEHGCLEVGGYTEVPDGAPPC